ncbi:NupC/NupG family nucleoside CNT transporter [Occallatibacter riparius]|uniref:NupC/NupG family nucleoside CNT transporter n=1 Tax=Occallatibacter riparius TaxID=1002689 RepID=A0A9J7BN69_9BACT|nr:nucleoside transporter C-terminal domain-containing protein [Occallatibacter riparius]UWZ84071.1 NupC/NupG family nucleoside CNT transporter [Occallatibacter riparius]
MDRFTGILGILAVLAAAWLFSTNRSRIRWRTVAWGLSLQVIFAFFVLRFTFGQQAMAWAGDVVNKMLSATTAGTRVLFGELGLPNSGAFGKLIAPNSGAIFAFQVLPTIIFISAFFAVMYHIGVMQQIIRAFAWIMLKTMRISGAESMNVAASIFMGQTEAPLTIRPFLSRATRSELMTIMTSGMAHVSGGIMAMYISQGIEAKHLLAAVIMTSPGTILVAKMLVPETEIPDTEGKVIIPKDEQHKDENLIGAIARGTIDGGKLAMNVAIMLISFLALVALLDMLLAWVHGGLPWIPPSLGQILGYIFWPVAWLIGVPAHDCGLIGNLLGTRMALNEVIAYIALGAQKAMISPRSFTIATFALCGFANLGSIGMQIGGIGALVPERRNDLAKLGVRAMLAGTMANLISASIAGMFLG